MFEFNKSECLNTIQADGFFFLLNTNSLRHHVCQHRKQKSVSIQVLCLICKMFNVLNMKKKKSLKLSLN